MTLTTASGRQFLGLTRSLARNNAVDHAESWTLAIEQEAAAAERARLAGRVRGWLSNPEWPMFGPGIGRGPLDAGRMASRTAVQQVLTLLEEQP